MNLVSNVSQVVYLVYSIRFTVDLTPDLLYQYHLNQPQMFTK